MELIVALLALAVLAVPVMLIVALLGLSSLKGRVHTLEAEVRKLRAQSLTTPLKAGQAITAPAPPIAVTQAGTVSAAAQPRTPPVPSAAALPPTPSSAPVSEAPSGPAVTAKDDGQESGRDAVVAVPDAIAPPSSEARAAASQPVPAPSTANTQDAPRPEQAPSSTTAPTPTSPDAVVTDARPVVPATPTGPAAPSPIPGVHPPVSGTQLPAAQQRATPRPPVPSGPDPFTFIKRWFTEGNVPVKVGVLVLLTGVAALLKYAGDQGWFYLSISMRLAAVAAAALGALGFAWSKRKSHRSFALSMQGGAIGVLLLDVFAAFKLYALIPVSWAFLLSVALVTALGVLAVLQDARALAVLGILAGFLAPIWLSTGAGNHVVLFSYYALLNAAIFAIAWLRDWRELNLLGWAFTWGIGVMWGLRSYETGKYATTQPFLILFFVLYLLLPILSARKRAPKGRDLIDGSIVFGTPLVAFTAQAALLEGARTPLSLCALGLAAIYAGLWAWQRRTHHPLLGQAYGMLAAGFATLAVPLALSARATSAVFAVEGAALIWVGLRQRQALSRWAGTALQFFAAVSFLFGVFFREPSPMPLANPAFAGALLLAVAAFATAWWYHDAKELEIASLFYLWGLGWWVRGVVYEILAHVPKDANPDVMLVALALTSLLAAEVHRRRAALALRLTVLGTFLLAAVVALAQVNLRGQPLTAWGASAWAVFALAGVRSLICLRGRGDVAVAAQFSWSLLWPLLFSLAARDVVQVHALAEGWAPLLVGAPWLALLAMVLFGWKWLRQPVGEGFDVCRSALLGLVLLVVGIGWLRALQNAGDSAPLPWLPVLNPLDLAQLVALALAAAWLWSSHAPSELAQQRVPLLSIAGFMLATCITLRAVHHWGGVPWDASLWRDNLTQTTLTIVWSVLGVAGWIAGSRRGQRALWLAGAVLMAVVLAKLVLVDRRYLGDLLGIGSFLAFGLMCTIVGWFAPAPPRAPSDKSDASNGA